jgi:hypothetical protein
MPEAVADHAYKPEEGDPGERQQTQREGNGTRSVFEPHAAIRRIGRDGKPDERDAAGEQHRKDDPGDGGGARRLEFLAR